MERSNEYKAAGEKLRAANSSMSDKSPSHSSTPDPSRFPGLISIFPIIRYACLTENKPDQLNEARFRANIVREDQGTALAGLDADHGVRRLPVMAAFVEAATLRAVESDNT